LCIQPEFDSRVEWLIRPHRRQVATHPARKSHARHRLDVVRPEHRYTESQIALTALTEDAKEGLAAFAEKRKPLWKGK